MKESTPRGGSWTADLERRQVPTIPFFLRDILRIADVSKCDAFLSGVCDAINAKLQELHSEGASEIEIKWVNRLDRETNPDGMIGHFVLNAIRKGDGTRAT